jgi:hypothetical protein
MVDEEWRFGKTDLRIALGEEQAGRKRFVMQGEHGFDEAGHASRRGEMTDVGLDRADGAERLFARGLLEGSPQAKQFMDKLARHLSPEELMTYYRDKVAGAKLSAAERAQYLDALRLGLTRSSYLAT